MLLELTNKIKLECPLQWHLRPHSVCPRAGHVSEAHPHVWQPEERIDRAIEKCACYHRHAECVSSSMLPDLCDLGVRGSALTPNRFLSPSTAFPSGEERTSNREYYGGYGPWFPSGGYEGLVDQRKQSIVPIAKRPIDRVFVVGSR